MPAEFTSLVQLVSLLLAGLALIMGAYLLIIGKRPWRGGESEIVAPRVRLLGLSYILVFGSAMIQIVIVVVFLEARASRRSARLDQSERLDSRLGNR